MGRDARSQRLKLALRFAPGVLKTGTRYQSKGRWYDAHLVRFLDGAIRPVGGWEALATTGATISGTIRSLLGWRFDGVLSPYLAVGTHTHIYTFTAGSVVDRTPGGLVTGGVDTVYSTGAYGTGNYGLGPYGTGDSAQATETEAAGWSLDNFGNYLLGVLSPSDGKLWVWNGITGTMTLADASAPTNNRGVVVTPERFVVLLGANGNLRRIAWADQESLTTWTSSITNKAGGFNLPGSGRLMCGKRGRGETLLFTDEDVFSMRFIGGTLVYGFEQVGVKCGVIAPRAVAMLDAGRAVWMGRKGFFIYDGYSKPVLGDVTDAVFADFNDAQRAKCYATTMAELGEVHFYYCSGSSMEPNRYVIYNYRENHWTPGILSRTAGMDRGAFTYPVFANVTSLYEHEKGSAHSGAAAPWLESGPIEIGDGDQLMTIKQFIPDEATRAGQALGSTQLKLYAALYPTATEKLLGPFAMKNPTSTRGTARQVRVRIEEVLAGDWRVGVPRLDIEPGSAR